MSSASKISMFSVMLCFFAMGFVDLVGIASNYVKADFALSDSTANILPSLVFFWFLIFSVPTGMLMNRIGRKKTVLLSLAVTVVSLLLPLLGESFTIMLVSFSLLGIGNALMQTSLNPLVQSVITGGNLAAMLTFGQFVKAIASFMAPYIAMWGAMGALPTFGLGWRVLFPIYMAIGIVATAMLWATPISEPSVAHHTAETAEGGRKSGFSLYRSIFTKIVVLSFVGIICHVGIDVGTNTTAPKILMERLGMTLNEAAFATSLYFIFRTIGCFTGTFFLRVMSNRLFFVVSVVMMALSMAGLAVGETKPVLYVAIALVGYGNSNIFSLVFSQAILSDRKRQNEISGLMIMGLFGGTIFPLLMGVASDAIGQVGAVAVMACGVVYLAFYSLTPMSVTLEDGAPSAPQKETINDSSQK